MKRLSRLVVVALVAATLSGCAAAMAYKKGFEAAQRHDWDAAVGHYRQAVQDDPDRPEYRIALERAMVEAALIHASAGKEFEAKGELDAALREYRRASEYEPANRQLAAKVAELDLVIREKIETSRPRSQMADMREQARRMSTEPILNPASREPIDFKFGLVASVRDILNFLGASSGINVTFTGDYRDPPGYSRAARRRDARAGAAAGAVGQRRSSTRCSTSARFSSSPTTSRTGRSTRSRSSAPSSCRTPTRRRWCSCSTSSAACRARRSCRRLSPTRTRTP